MRADFAAMAGAARVDPSVGGNPQRACDAAWEYFFSNDGAAAVPASPCGAFAGIAACTDVSLPVSATQQVGEFTVTITTPVPDAALEMEGRIDPAIDGVPCERIAVTARRSHAFVLAGVTGFASGSAARTAVARAGAGSDGGVAAPLVVLDPTGCNALTVSGQAEVRVLHKNGVPGVIAIDSSATEAASRPERNCTSAGSYALDASGTLGARIEAQDAVDAEGNTIKASILQFALKPGQGNLHAYDPADDASGRIRPLPEPGAPVTRAPADHRWNCSQTNGCPAWNTRRPAIDDLRAAIGTGGPPAGFQRYTGPCRTSAAAAPIVVPAGNWWVPCGAFDISSSVTFEGGNIVFDGSVSTGSSSGALTVNASANGDAYVYLRSGRLSKGSQSSLRLPRTFVYLASGRVDFGAGTGVLDWSAPLAGPFEDLALWSESAQQHEVGGQATLSLVGVFFTPNADPFRYSGQGDQVSTKAQFIAYRVEATGQGALLLEPDGERMLLIPYLGVRLVR